MTASIALGTMHFGTKISPRKAHEILDTYLELGGEWIDTANCYAFWGSDTGHGGQSESIIGDWIRQTKSQGLVKVSTKAGAEPQRPGSFPDAVEGLSRTSIYSAVEASSRRLNVEKIDMFWAHMEDHTQSIHEVTDTFGSLITDNFVNAVGLSNHPAWYAAAANVYAQHQESPGFTALQLRESYLHPRPDTPVEGEDHPNGMMTPESRDYAQRNNIWLWAYTPLMTGLYERPEASLPDAYEHPGSYARLTLIRQWAAKLEITTSQMVLAWLCSNTPSITPVVGCRTPAQLREAFAATQLTLPSEAVLDLNAAC